MIRKGGFSAWPLSSWPVRLAASALILLAALLTTAGVVFVTPTPTPAPSPTCVPQPRT